MVVAFASLALEISSAHHFARIFPVDSNLPHRVLKRLLRSERDSWECHARFSPIMAMEFV